MRLVVDVKGLLVIPAPALSALHLTSSVFPVVGAVAAVPPVQVPIPSASAQESSRLCDKEWRVQDPPHESESKEAFY